MPAGSGPDLLTRLRAAEDARRGALSREAGPTAD
jgi:hypothetical protein